MPTLPKLRLQALEDRSLPSAEIDPPAPVVITGTEAHDVITLKRVAGDRVTVTVESFLDPEWTRPTGDSVVRYEVDPGSAELASEMILPSYPAQRVFGDTTGTIRVEAGAGTDRVDVVDLCGRPYFVSGSHRTDDAPPDPDIPVLRFWLLDEAGGRWARAHDVWTMEIKERYAGTLTEGVDMAEGAAVAVRFDGVPSWWRLEFIEPFPWPDCPVELAVISADDAGAEVPLDAAGLELLTGAEGEDWAASGFDPEAGGDLGPDGPPGQGDLADLWVAGPDEQSDWWTGDGEDGADWFAGEAADDWLVTDLETAGE